MQMKKLIVLSAAMIRLFMIPALLMTLGCSKDEMPDRKEVVRPVKYFEINPGGLEANIEYSGKIQAVQEAFMAFEVPGKINIFPVKEGERVKKGQVLARIDPRDYQSTLDSRTAHLNATRADYERARELYENNTISKRDLDVARRNFEVAKADVSASKKTLGDTRIVAPFSGLVAKTLVQNFENIQAKQPVLILQDDSSLELVVDIPEQDYAKVDKAMSLSEMTLVFKPEITVSTFPGRRFKAMFKETATTADTATRTFEITLGFDTPADISILPGMTARLIITGGPDKKVTTIMIPAKSVLSDNNKQPTVWLIDPVSNTVKRQAIGIGNMTGQNIVVTKGLKIGDVVAVSGVHQLREGMTVRRYEK